MPLEVTVSRPPELWRTVDPDRLTELSEQITTLSARLQAGTYRLLRLIAAFDRLEGWKREGFGSCAEWLAHATRLDKATAREKVRVARSLMGLPETSAAMARGELSFSQVRALTRVADPESEGELLRHARSTSAAGLERLVRSWRRIGREDEAALERRLHRSRCLSIFPDGEGTYLIRGRLEPEVGALLMRAIEAAGDALYRGSVPETTPEQRRADALALLAERALAAGFGEAGEGGARAERYQVLLHVEGAGLEAEGGDAGDPRWAEGKDRASESEGPEGSLRTERGVRPEGALTLAGAPQSDGGGVLEDGTRVSAETSRRLACDAHLVRVRGGRGGTPLEVGARSRTVPPRLRRALQVRDGGCRFPGCGSRFTDAHHIRHWADGGATHLDNMVLLCRAHHRLLHEGGFRLEPDPARPGRPVFLSPKGIPIPEAPPRITLDGRPLWREGGEPARAGGDEPDGRQGRDAGGPETARSGGEEPPARRNRDAARADPTSPRWEEDVPLALYLKALAAVG